MGSSSSESESKTQPEADFSHLKKYLWYFCPTCEWKSQDPKIFQEHLNSHEDSTPEINEIMEQLNQETDTCLESSLQMKRLQNFAAKMKK